VAAGAASVVAARRDAKLIDGNPLLTAVRPSP
jgi:hypothetical protein